MGYATPKMIARYSKAAPAHGSNSRSPKPANFQGIMDSRWAPKQTSSAAGPNVAKGPAKGIADSRWAPKGTVFVPEPKPVAMPSPSPCPRPRSPSPSPSSTTTYYTAVSSLDSFYTAKTHLSPSSTKSSPRRQSPELNSPEATRPSSEVSNMYQVADLDDTAGFMAAARALAKKNETNASSSKDKDVSGSAKSEPNSPRRSLSPRAPEFVPSSSSSSSSSPVAGFNPKAEEFVPSGSSSTDEKTVDSAQDAAQDVGLDAGLNESDTKEVTASPKDIVNSAQDSGLDESSLKEEVTKSPDDIVDSAQETGLDAGLNESDAKNKAPSEPKMTTDINDTSAFMAAARACLQEFGTKKTVTASKKIVNSAQGVGLDESGAKKMTESSNEFVTSAQGTGLDEPDAKKMTASSDKIVDSAKGVGLDESDAKKEATTAPKDIAKYTQGIGLDGSVVKKEATTSEMKANDIDDTAGFMAAVRARLHKPDVKKTVTASNEIVISTQEATQDVGLDAGLDAGLDESSLKKEVTASSEDIAGSTQGATQDIDLDGGLNEPDVNKMTMSPNDIAKSTQDTGLADSDAKTKMPAAEIKKTTDVNDTSAFMAAARACLQKFDAKKSVTTSNKIVKSGTQDTGLVDSDKKDKATASSNEIVKPTQSTGLDDPDTKNKAPTSGIKTVTDVDDTSGFMAAARAWKAKARNMSPVYTQAVVKTPDQLSDHTKKSQEPSPVKEPVKSSAKVEKASSGIGMTDGVLDSEPTRDKTPITLPNNELPKKPANFDDTAGFMAAARALISGNMPSVHTQGVAKTPDQMSGHKEQTQSSPGKESFATPVEKPSSENCISSGDLRTEKPKKQTYESAREEMSVASPKKPTNVDDTAGFIAAARALNSRSISPTAKNQTVAKPSGQASGNMELAHSSVKEESFKPSTTKMENASSENDTADIAAPSQEKPNSVVAKPTRETVSTASPSKPDIDDTGASMAAAGKLTHSPGISVPFSGANNPNDNSGNGTKANDAAKVGEKKEAVTDAAGDQALNTDTAKRSNSNNGSEAKQSNSPTSSGQSECSLQKKVRDGKVIHIWRETFTPSKPPMSNGSNITNQPQTKGPESQAKILAQQLEREKEIANIAEDDRANQFYFKSWGNPAPRNKSPARVRRIILRRLPRSWANPSKALSLVHGGAIDRVNIAPSGNAHVYFCDPKACDAYYEKYANGIAVGSSLVFVERGRNVDVVSSQLTYNLSKGATRVVRAVGFDMNTSMARLYQMASTHNRKVEQIVENYIPDEAREVQFRFCSIEDAVRFRSMLIRDMAWESCKVQFQKDPCEAAGPHFD